MKKLYITITALSIITCGTKNFAQNAKINSGIFQINPSQVLGGGFEPADIDNISPLETEQMKADIKKNIEMLNREHPGLCNKTSMVHPQFIWPTQPKAGFNDYGYYIINYFIDHDVAFPNNVLDYTCGNRTYDWASGNHAGTDIVLWPFPWLRMDQQVMEVVAAAPGVIVNKVDGNYDRNCVQSSSQAWNNIHVLHADSSQSWYLHFKSGSLTTKGVGDSVALGEYLGTAGSSGSSSVPHLHFQVMAPNGSVIDPWQGACNNFNPDSWWQSQQTYKVPSINHISTQSAVYVSNCPNQEITNEKDTFNVGDNVYFYIYYRDIDTNALTHINIYDPFNQNVSNWDFHSPWPFYTGAYAGWFNVITSAYYNGQWKFEAQFNGQTYFHNFYINNPTNIEEQNFLNTITLSPNPASDELIINNPAAHNKNVGVIISDAIGKEIYSTQVKVSNLKLQTSNFENGIYFVQLKSGNQIKTQKLIINH